MLAVDFEVEDGVRAGSRGVGNDSDTFTRGVDQAFAGTQGAGFDEGLAVVGPEGVVGRGADRVVFAGHVQVDDVGGVVLELAGHQVVVSVLAARGFGALID